MQNNVRHILVTRCVAIRIKQKKYVRNNILESNVHSYQNKATKRFCKFFWLGIDDRPGLVKKVRNETWGGLDPNVGWR